MSKKSPHEFEVTPELQAEVSRRLSGKVVDLKPTKKPAISEDKKVIVTPDIDELVKTWLKYEKTVRNKSDNTITAYQIGFDIFLKYLGDKIIPQVTAMDIGEFREELAKSYAPKTVNLRLTAVKSFYRFAVNTGLMPYSPAVTVEGMKANSSTHKKDVLTNQQVKALFATCADDTDQNVRDLAVLTLMLFCAVRIDEVHNANVTDLKTRKGRKVLFVKGKGRQDKDEFVIIPKDQETIIQAWINRRKTCYPKDDSLFPSVGIKGRGKRLSLRSLHRMIKTRMILAGIVLDPSKKRPKDKYRHGDIGVHSLRHTAINNSVGQGATVIQAKGMARHASINTTMVYIHDQDRMLSPAEDLINYDDE